MDAFYSYFDRKILFPLGELINGSAILHEFDKLKGSDWQSVEKINSIQNQNLKTLILHCYKNVPYYRDLFDSLKLKPEDFNNRSDLIKLPILTKNIIRDNYDKLISKDIAERNYKKYSTGGSTGMPLQFLSDISSWNISWASTFRAWHWYGFHLGEKIFTIGGHSLVGEKKNFSKKGLFEKYLLRNFKFSSSEMKTDDMHRHYNAFMRLKPKAIRGYASTLYVFAKYIEDNRLPVHQVDLILTTGEVLLPLYRVKVQEVFKTQIFDNYGAGDGGIASHECYMHEGLHISEERCIIEIVDEKDKIVEDGVTGHVISTDLHNYVFPFIRYKVGDLSYIKKNLCSCGRKSRMLGEVLGRNGKLLYSKSGVPVSPTMLPVMLYPDLDYNNLENQILYNKIDRFQIHQDAIGNIKVLLKMKNEMDKQHALFSHVVENYKNAFPDSKIEVEFVGSIKPMPSGKEDYVISEYQSK